MAERNIDRIITAPPVHWVGDGFRVHGYFNVSPDLQRKLSPFLLLDYGPRFDFPATSNPRRGVGPHPHRGFETVTVAFEGSVAHHDSTGAGGVIRPGDVQWMTAGAGILHREYHEAEFARAGGPMQMAQIWVNLPRAHKMTAPGYQPLTARDIAVAELPDGAGTARVIAGQLGEVKGPAKTFTPIELYDLRLRANSRAQLSFPARHNVAFLVMEGELTLNGQAAKKHDLVVFANDGEAITLAPSAESQILVMAGEPIDEPIASYGPFVMNTRRELEQAIVDFNAGKFGHLAD